MFTLYDELKSSSERACPLTEESKAECHVRGPFKKWDLKGNISVGSYTSINGFFKARGVVYIGKYCAFGNEVSLVSGNHKVSMPNQQVWLQQRLGFTKCVESKGPICIAHNVWLGDKVVVLSGVNIGHGAVVGAGAIVTKNVEPFSIVAGNPAKEIGKRFSPEVIKEMLKLSWWDWSFEKMKKNQAFFELNIGNSEVLNLSDYVVD